LVSAKKTCYFIIFFILFFQSFIRFLEQVAEVPGVKVPKEMTEEEKKEFDEENKKLVTYYRRVAYEGVTRVFVYVKRLGRVVNFQITNIPYMIERFVAFYLSGDASSDLDKLETSLERSLALVRAAKQDIEMAM
jgi:hypothetical protein